MNSTEKEASSYKVQYYQNKKTIHPNILVHYENYLLKEDDDVVKKLDKKSSKSSLPKAVQDLVCLIFDVESMKKAMMEFEVCDMLSVQIE